MKFELWRFILHWSSSGDHFTISELVLEWKVKGADGGQELITDIDYDFCGLIPSVKWDLIEISYHLVL